MQREFPGLGSPTSDLAVGSLAGATIARPPIDPTQFTVNRIRALRGPNYWRLAPVIAADVRLGTLEHVTSADLPAFSERLLAALPSLADHPCSRGAPGGFVSRLYEGTHLPHVLEHVALELQTLAGCDVSFGRIVPSGDEGVWWVIVAYEEEEVGIAGMREGARLIRACLAGEYLDMRPVIEGLERLYEDVRLGPSTAAIVEEARRRGIPVRRLNARSLVRLGMGRNLRRIQATLTDRSSSIAVEIAQSKEETKRVLGSIGLPVPEGLVARSLESARAIAQDLGYPVILKPHDGSHGRGVSSRIGSPEELEMAWVAARRASSRVIVERFHVGRDHRVLVVNGRFVACAERVAAHVVGDGTSSIAALIERANADPRRGVGHRKILTRLPRDRRTEEFLALHGYTLDSVPRAGERVFLRATANLSTGGTAIDRTDEIHPENIACCEMAADAIGLDIAGIDVITPNIAIPFRENQAVILEVNAAPGIRMHTHPAIGRPRNVSAPIVDMLYPPGRESRIPIIAVTGTNGKTTTVRLIAHLFRNTGRQVGFTTTDGVYLQHRCVMQGDMTGPFAANVILSNRSVDVAVLETARGGLMRSGLGFDECDVGVVLNVAADHLGLAGITTLEQLAELKSVVAAVVRREGHAILNADDPRVFAMRERTMADVVLFSTRDPEGHSAVRRHIERGGIAACLQDGQIVLRRGRVQIPIAAEREVPLLHGGLARFQRQNVLAAVASAHVSGMRYDDIRGGLLSFVPSPTLTPGRLNLFALPSGARVLVDYAHNAAALEGLLDFVRHLPARRRVAVIGMPGDRRDADVRDVGRQCARFHHVVVKEDADGRGRAPGEIARLLSEGLRAGGLPQGALEVVPNELDAVRRA
ncbi:MAG TPA: cyanophycin synthetase, partial [Gemmatimonadaceae bacterium]